MNEKTDIRVDVEAAKALLRWKSQFAEEVAEGARQLALQSGEESRVSLAHYRRAAQSAVRSLLAAIAEEEPSGDNQKAA